MKRLLIATPLLLLLCGALLTAALCRADVVTVSVSAQLGSQTCTTNPCSLSNSDGSAEASVMGLNVATEAGLGSGRDTDGSPYGSASLTDQETELFTGGSGEGIATLTFYASHGGEGNEGTGSGKVDVGFGDGSCSVGFSGASCSSSGPGAFAITTPFTYGVPFLLTFSLVSNSSAVGLGELETGSAGAGIIQISASSVPEPSSIWLSSLSIAALGWLTYHRLNSRRAVDQVNSCHT
jgi:hypothetical protein